MDAAGLLETSWLAQQLHDGVLQTLALARIRIDKALAAPGPLPRELGEELRELFEHEIATLRELMRRPDPPPPLPDLPTALAATARHLGSVTGIGIFVEDRTLGRFPWTDDAPIVHRIAREAIHNAAKHSGAEHIRIVLDDQQDRLTCEVLDDGCGFDPSRTPKGFGMTAMHAEALALGGELRIDSQRGGTRVTLCMPRRDPCGPPASAGGRSGSRQEGRRWTSEA